MFPDLVVDYHYFASNANNLIVKLGVDIVKPFWTFSYFCPTVLFHYLEGYLCYSSFVFSGIVEDATF